MPRELAEAELFGHTRGAFTGAAVARRGLFREADGGTLLIDEIGELDLLTQGKLLPVLQEREVRPLGEDHAQRVDVRIIATTNCDLGKQVETGRFRQDLYYRLNVVHIELPALRTRPEDVAPLVEHFADRFAHRYGLGQVRIADTLMAKLQAASWPGNVRELEHAIERLLALAEDSVIGPEGFEPREGQAPAPLAATGVPLSLKERMAIFERGLIAAELERCHGNQSEAARRLGVSRPTLIDRLKKHRLR